MCVVLITLDALLQPFYCAIRVTCVSKKVAQVLSRLRVVRPAQGRASQNQRAHGGASITNAKSKARKYISALTYIEAAAADRQLVVPGTSCASMEQVNANAGADM